MRNLACLILGTSVALCSSSALWADGGAIRLSQRQGNYQITVLTTPTPLRTGRVDISVLVQKAGTGELVSDEQVAIKATQRGHAGGAISHMATAEAATNKLFRAADFELREAGWWDVEVAIDGPLGNEHARVAMEVAPPLPKWLALWPWFSWPVLVVVLFGVHRWAVRAKA
jgi:YtkA-like